MRLARAAIGIAAMGAGLVVASMIRRWEKGAVEASHLPPEPNQLIGYPESQKSAAESAQVFRDSRDRPV